MQSGSGVGHTATTCSMLSSDGPKNHVPVYLDVESFPTFCFRFRLQDLDTRQGRRLHARTHLGQRGCSRAGRMRRRCLRWRGGWATFAFSRRPSGHDGSAAVTCRFSGWAGVFFVFGVILRSSNRGYTVIERRTLSRWVTVCRCCFYRVVARSRLRLFVTLVGCILLVRADSTPSRC